MKWEDSRLISASVAASIGLLAVSISAYIMYLVGLHWFENGFLPLCFIGTVISLYFGYVAAIIFISMLQPWRKQ